MDRSGRAGDEFQVSPINNFSIVLDYILDHAEKDERPYLEVEVLGKSLLGLLDSGASKTILGGKGFVVAQELGLPLKTNHLTTCTVANGNRCHSVGAIDLPICLRGRLFLIEAIVVPELSHVLILGADFWRTVGIVPDLRHNEWHFSSEPILVNSVEHVKSQSLLTPLEKMRLNAVIERNMTRMGKELGCTNRVEHVIVTSSPPIKQRYYRVNPLVQEQIDRELDKMLELGVVEPSQSPWSSPILLVKKKDGTFRFCVDFRKLNSVTVRDSYPLPMVSDILDKLRHAKYISSLDVKSAYWQVPVAEASRQYTAFTVPNRGLFQFRRMPFGLHNAPATWMRLLDSVLGHDLEPHVFAYLDDVVIVTETFEQHLTVLEEVFRRLLQANITVSLDKCQYCKPELIYLGYKVDKNGLHVDPSKVKAMLELPTPTCVSEVRRVVGTFSWYRRFIPEFSTIIAPITALLKKSSKFLWTPECAIAFQHIKECLVAAPILSCPDYSRPFVVQTDASAYGIGCVLSQPHPEGDKVICYLSRSLTRQERAYSTTQRECLAVVWSLEKLRPYLELVPFTVVTDHYSLLWLQNLKDLNGRLARWSVRLQQFDFTLVHRKGKEHVVPDALSRAVPIVDSVDAPCDDEPLFKGCEGDRWYQRMVDNVNRNPLKFSSWRYSNGYLYKYVDSKFANLAPPVDSWKLVVPKKDRLNVIVSAHEAPTSGHVGVFKTFHRIVEKYYWPCMRADVAKFVRRCTVCAAHKPSQEKATDRMVSHVKANRPWEMVSTDIIGPLPKSKSGNSFILVVTDYLSKFCLLFPLRKASTEAIIRKIENDVFLVFGVPRLLLCDNGPQYRSKQFIQFCKGYNCQIKFNANYHPRANPTERINRTVKTMLAMYVSDNHRTWDVNIHKIACAIRTSTHEVMKLTPYFVNFGRNMMLSGEDYRPENLLLDDDGRQNGTLSRNVHFKDMFQDVRKRLEEAGKKSCERYNLRSRHVEYLPNQLVWKRNYVLSDAAKHFSQKLAPKFVGPYFIKKRLSPWVYELRDSDGNSKGVWHTKDLKPCAENLDD